MPCLLPYGNDAWKLSPMRINWVQNDFGAGLGSSREQYWRIAVLL
jgi:hypothetical protein